MGAVTRAAPLAMLVRAHEKGPNSERNEIVRSERTHFYNSQMPKEVNCERDGGCILKQPAGDLGSATPLVRTR